MSYCPKCLTEYVEGTPTCEDCGARLLPGPPPHIHSSGSPDSKLVAARVFTGATALMDVEMAKNILEDQGIPSVVAGEFSAELLPVLDVPLLVREEDAERAGRILHDYFDAELGSPTE